MNVLVATDKPFAKEAVDGIKNIITQAGFNLTLLEKYKTKEELIQAVKNSNAVIIRSDIIDKEVIEQAENLKIVVRAGAGYDNIDINACSAKGIIAMNTPGQNANAVAELVFGLVLNHIRNYYDGSVGTELRGKTIGVHAYGYIGKIVARIAKGFGMEVYAYDPFIDKETMMNSGVNACCTVEELYKKCQYISLHIPATDQTKKSINYQLLSSMPKNAVLINTARAEVINENDLLKIFEQRQDFSYISDIAPDCKTEIESKYKGRYYFTTKKLGAQTEEANINAGLAAAKQIVAFFINGDRTFQVNR
ncbi:MAG: 3-phosphoglycerate dehydrogenase [Bacteroidales bacterium]